VSSHVGGPERAGERVDAVSGVLRALIHLLSAFGHEAKARWLAERLDASQQGPPDATARTLEELHGVVLGMGGLMDLHLGGASVVESEAANVELERLADQLYRLTR